MNMGFVTNLKNSIKKEISAYKYNKDLENDPDVVRNRLDAERKQIRMEKEKIFAQKQLERDKAELRELKNNTGIRGQIKSGLGSVRGYLDNVKKKNGSAERFKLKNPQSNIVSGRSSSVFEIKGSGSQIQNTNLRGMHSGSNSSYRPFGSGVLNQEVRSKPKKKQSKTVIIIK